MRRKVPPLHIWIITAILFLLLQVALYFYYKNVVEEQQRIAYWTHALADIDYLLTHIEEHINSQADAYRVVVVGSSLVQCAIDCTENFTQEGIDCCNTPLQVHKIFSPDKTLDFFTTQAKVFDELIQLKPDLICLEKGLIPEHIVDESSNKALDFSLPYFGAIFRHLYSSRPWVGIDLCGKVKDYQIDHIVTTDLRAAEVKSFEEENYLHPYLKSFRDQGTKVVFLDIPVPAVVAQKMQASPQKQDLDQSLKAYKEHFDIDSWKYPDQMPSRYYSDELHLNSTGRVVYSKWLAQQIINQIEN